MLDKAMKEELKLKRLVRKLNGLGQRPKACVECGAKFGHVEGCSHVNDGMKRDALIAGKSVHCV